MQTLINTRIWALEPSFMEKMQPLVIARLNAGHDLSIFKHDYEAALATTKNQKYNKVFTRNMRIGMLPLFGSMSKYGDMCSYGTQDLIKMKDAMNADPDIDAIVMVTDSPGGSVLGTTEFGRALKASPKPIVSFVDGDMASAAYWAGANTSHIMMNSEEPTAGVGSIGALYVHVNQSKMIADKVGEVKIIRAPQSVDKAKVNSIEPLTEELEAGIVAELEEITNYFIETVTTGRGSSLKGNENIFTGKMYKEKYAKKWGMIDSAGTINDAIDMAAKLARKNSTIKVAASLDVPALSNNPKSIEMSLKDWFGGAKTAAEGEAINVSTEELGQLRADMQEASQQNDTLTAANTQLTEANVQLTASNAELAEQNAQLEEENAALQAQVHELEGKPDATSSKVAKEGDAVAEEAQATYVAADRSWNANANKALGRN